MPSSITDIESAVDLMAWLAARDLTIYPRAGRIGGLFLAAVYSADGNGEPITGTGPDWITALRSAIAKWEEAHGVELVDGD